MDKLCLSVPFLRHTTGQNPPETWQATVPRWRGSDHKTHLTPWARKFILFTMRVCGQEFSSNILDRIGQIIATIPGLSRRALSRHVCEWLNWRSTNGALQEGSCRKAL